MLARCVAVAALTAFMLALAAPSPALGVFPGQNGRIAYDDGLYSYSVNPDGADGVALTAGPDNGWNPEWSPDGRRIVFESDRDGTREIYVMNADGSAQTRLTDDTNVNRRPAWSADGQRIVFTSGAGSAGDLWLMAPDGSNRARLTSLPDTEEGADWSPAGSRIAFVRPDGRIWSIRADGTDLRAITPPPAFPVLGTRAPDWSPDGSRIVYLETSLEDGEYCESIQTIAADGGAPAVVRPATCESGVSSNFYSDPAWSPDGTRIASSDDLSLFTVRIDGSDLQALPGFGLTTDWQPVLGSYARPRAATPISVRLVPAFAECTAPNANHGAPLASPSCNPPAQTSAFLTLNAPDRPFPYDTMDSSTGFLTLKVFCDNGQAQPCRAAGDQANVQLETTISDVRCAGVSGGCPVPGGTYDGKLLFELTVRITDKQNGTAQKLAGTVTDLPLEFGVQCGAGSCSATTTADSVFPGLVQEGNRAIWQLGQARVMDGGLDGDLAAAAAPASGVCPPACTGNGGEATFLTSGLFLP